MRLAAIGREHIALGYMQLLYHDAKVRFLKRATSEENFGYPVKDLPGKYRGEKERIEGGQNYAERTTYRGIFNYWLKIALAGVVTNTGVKSNSHQFKKYQKELKKQNLPPVPDVDF